MKSALHRGHAEYLDSRGEDCLICCTEARFNPNPTSDQRIQLVPHYSVQQIFRGDTRGNTVALSFQRQELARNTPGTAPSALDGGN